MRATYSPTSQRKRVLGVGANVYQSRTPLRSSTTLHVEEHVQHVTIQDDVVLPLDPQPAGILHGLL